EVRSQKCEVRMNEVSTARTSTFLPRPKTKAPSDPGKTENEGIQRILPETVRQAGLILLFVGEVGPAFAEPDERSPTGILTSASNRLPAFPSRTAEQWPWEFVSRYSGA